MAFRADTKTEIRNGRIAKVGGNRVANPDLLQKEARIAALAEINSEENHSRKREHQKRFDVYRERQDRYILERLQREFSQDTVDQMRKIFSVNLTTKIIDEMSSVYTTSPEREFSSDSRETLSESEKEQLDALYTDCRVDVQMRRANKFYNLHDQCALMVVPNNKGDITVKAISPLYYDVIPQCDDVEKAYAYILNVWDFDLYKTVRDENSEPTQMNRYRQNDRRDQMIADDNDRKKEQERYVVWTEDIHFTMDGKGNILGEVIENPIGRLPFIDIADEKDFQFFVRRGTSVVDFALDFGLVLSDTANTIRLQNYSQAVMSSEKQPQNLTVGPNNVLWLQLDPQNPGATPKFEFVSPSPDISGSIEFAEVLLRLFLSSRGVDPATISGKGEAKTFSSGIERLLAMLDKFEATRSDYDLFKGVEKELYMLLRDWSNLYQDVSGEGELKPELKLGKVNEDVNLDVSFNEPGIIQTKSEKEDSVIKLMDQGLMSRKEAIMELREVGEDRAMEIMEEIDEDDGLGDEDKDTDDNEGNVNAEIQEGAGEIPEGLVEPEAEDQP